MSTGVDPALRRALRHELEALRGEWAWFLVLGIALIVLGTIAVGAAVVATLVTVVTFGVLLVLGGIVQAVGAFWAREWSGFFLQLLTAVLYVVLGVLFLRDPGNAALAMTLLLAGFLLVGGIFKVVGALALRLPHWGWPLASGVIDLLLGVMIWAQWPLSGFWVIGLFVGIDLLFNGWQWVMLALALRSRPRSSPT